MTVLDELKKPFPAAKIGKLPRLTCAACSKKNCTQHKKCACDVCKNYISTSHIHLDYVGHAEVTRRLLAADPSWFYEPVAFDSDGLPKLDSSGGLWIKLTIHDDDGNPITRYGYGDAPGKRDAMKEVIGDALRNAAMRFGVALDLWSKERDDYIETEGETPTPKEVKLYAEWLAMIVSSSTRSQLTGVGQQMAAADITEDERKELRAEFTKRMNELKDVA